ncbi:hypothetical protein PAMA_018815 [Pampus argenteus]
MNSALRASVTACSIVGLMLLSPAGLQYSEGAARREEAPLSASRLLTSLLEVRPSRVNQPQQAYKYPQAQLLLCSLTHSQKPEAAPAKQCAPNNSSSRSWRATLGAEKHGDIHRRNSEAKMSTYVSSESRRVSPSVHGNKFDTAHRKKAVANIFENVNQDSLMRLFQKTGDMKAEERVRSIFSYTQDPEETARALMALKQRKKDKFLQIAGMLRQLLKLR